LFVVLAATTMMLLILCACDGGLKPPPPAPQVTPTTISGTITYRGGRSAWPTADSVVNVRVAAFKALPTASSGIIQAVSSGDAYFTPTALTLDSTLSKFADSTRYQITITEPVPPEVRYIAVAMLVDSSARSNIAAVFNPRAWRILGVYTTSGDNRQPTPLALTPQRDHRANVTVDFRNLPPQPF
jgi:hypothetical protein